MSFRQLKRERQRTADEVSKAMTMSKPGGDLFSGISSGDALNCPSGIRIYAIERNRLFVGT